MASAGSTSDGFLKLVRPTFTDDTCGFGKTCGSGCYCSGTNVSKCEGCACKKVGAVGNWACSSSSGHSREGLTVKTDDLLVAAAAAAAAATLELQPKLKTADGSHTSTNSFACTSDSDCQLNGVCRSGRCDCDAAWDGDDCGQVRTYGSLPLLCVPEAIPPGMLRC